MFKSFLEKAKGAVKEAADKVKQQAHGMAKLLQTSGPLLGEESYLVKPDRFVQRIHKKVYAMKSPVERTVEKGSEERRSGSRGSMSKVLYTGQADIVKIATFLNKRFGERYLIINLSDSPYDCSPFKGEVQEFFFPGYPAPPIKTIVQLCVAIEKWFAAQKAIDKERAAGAQKPSEKGSNATTSITNTKTSISGPAVLFHCQTGKGRTAVALACYLAWSLAFESPMLALDHVCSKLGMPVEMATIPSQRRYVEYFTTILDGKKPAARMLILSRVIIHSVPQFGVKSPGTMELPGRPGCRPELRVVKNGKLVFCGEHAMADRGKTGKPAVNVRAGDGGIKFEVDLETQEDVVISCYHIDHKVGDSRIKQKRVFMFRAQFYTGFVVENMLRFTRSALDGTAENDSRFPKDFFVEAFFESHPIGNDYRLPPSWKAINERARNIKAATQAKKERAARKAVKKKRKKERKQQKARERGLMKSKQDAAQNKNASDGPTTVSAEQSSRLFAKQNVMMEGNASDDGDEFYSEGSDSDSTASGASARAAATAPPEEFMITFSEGEEDEAEVDVAAIQGGLNVGNNGTDKSDDSRMATEVTRMEKSPPKTAKSDQFAGKSTKVKDKTQAATTQPLLSTQIPQPARPTPLRDDTITKDNAESTEKGGGGSSSPSSSATVENSDGWDVCATDAADGDVLALETHAAVDGSDEALADIESFLSNLDSK